MPLPRIRQLVFACERLSRADDLAVLLGLGEPFADPGVAAFGLENAVFAIGDQFLEVVAPLPGKGPDETAAGRFLTRNGEGGYMAIFEVEDIAVARDRIDAAGIRRIWNSDLAEISASHLHPRDVGAAIVSIDQPRPPGSWLWGGPGWRERSCPGRLTGATVTGLAALERWSTALGVEPSGSRLGLDGGTIDFVAGDREALAGFGIAVPNVDAVLDRARASGLAVTGNRIVFAGTALDLETL